MSRITFTALFTSVVMLTFVHGYPTGAPASACESMVPGHGVAAQSGASNYTISLSSTNYSCGMNIKVTLGADEFKGFFCQARTEVNDGGSKVGEFELGTQSGIKKECSNQGVTHDNRTGKSSVMFSWKPSMNHGNVYIVCTMVKEKTLFWTKIPSAMLTYQDEGGCNTGNGAGHVTSGMLLPALSFFAYIFCFY